MTTAKPACTREYRCHHLDSRRWEAVRFRPDDIVIDTSLKTGTTWTQRIVSLLIFGPDPLPMSLNMISPWIDARFIGPIDQIGMLAEAQTHRRFFKSHLPLDAFPYRDDIKLLFVGRDGRDVFMSMYNHHASYNDAVYEALNGGDDFIGEPMPRPAEIHEAFANWIGKSSFPWETDGYPFWSHFYHAQSFWNFRHLPNILFLHYNDMKQDLDREMRRVAAFLEIEIPERQWPVLVDAATFESMKKDADALLPELAMGMTGGAQSFIHKGTNGRWRDILTADELRLYDVAVKRALTPECARWLERGGAAGDPKSM
jgi:aryl sulfotransferase